jgi:hypothetical protein
LKGSDMARSDGRGTHTNTHTHIHTHTHAHKYTHTHPHTYVNTSHYVLPDSTDSHTYTYAHEHTHKHKHTRSQNISVYQEEKSWRGATVADMAVSVVNNTENTLV